MGNLPSTIRSSSEDLRASMEVDNRPETSASMSEASSITARDRIRRFFSRRKKPQKAADADIAKRDVAEVLSPPQVEEQAHDDKVVYQLPHSAAEIARLDAQHWPYKRIMGGNIIAPIDKDNIKFILEAATGSGVWAVDVAKEYPNAKVIGFDISTMFTSKTPPPNLEFKVINVLEPLPFDENSVDLLHARLLTVAIPATKWPDVIKEYFRVIKHGGYAQVVETDGVYYNTGKYGQKLTELFNTGLTYQGFDMSLCHKLTPFLTDAGFTEIEEKIHQFPMYPEGDQDGEFMARNLFEVAEGLKTPIVAGGSATEEEYDDMLKNMIPEFYETKTYMILKSYVCKKP